MYCISSNRTRVWCDTDCPFSPGFYSKKYGIQSIRHSRQIEQTWHVGSLLGYSRQDKRIRLASIHYISPKPKPRYPMDTKVIRLSCPNLSYGWSNVNLGPASIWISPLNHSQIHAHMQPCIHIWTHRHVWHADTPLPMHTHTCTRVPTCTNAYPRAPPLTHAHTYTHTHTHIPTDPPPCASIMKEAYI